MRWRLGNFCFQLRNLCNFFLLDVLFLWLRELFFFWWVHFLRLFVFWIFLFWCKLCARYRLLNSLLFWFILFIFPFPVIFFVILLFFFNLRFRFDLLSFFLFYGFFHWAFLLGWTLNMCRYTFQLSRMRHLLSVFFHLLDFHF